MATDDRIRQAENMLTEATRLRELAEQLEESAERLLAHERAAAPDATVTEFRPRPAGEPRDGE